MPGARSGRGSPVRSWTRCPAPGIRAGDVAVLLVSELFGNSVRHSGSGDPGETVTVAVRAGNGVVRVEVTDRSGPGGPNLVQPWVTGKLAAAWAGGGTGRGGVAAGRTVTWFELPHG